MTPAAMRPPFRDSALSLLLLLLSGDWGSEPGGTVEVASGPQAVTVAVLPGSVQMGGLPVAKGPAVGLPTRGWETVAPPEGEPPITSATGSGTVYP